MTEPESKRTKMVPQQKCGGSSCQYGFVKKYFFFCQHDSVLHPLHSSLGKNRGKNRVNSTAICTPVHCWLRNAKAGHHYNISDSVCKG